MSYNIRSYNIHKLYHWSKNIYQTYFKHGLPWNLEVADLLKLPKMSLGHDLSRFLKTHGFKVEPKLENHDVFHILAGCGTRVYEEVALQYYLLGNGKLSLYLIMVILTGTVCYSERWGLFWHFYLAGRKSGRFYHLDFKPILSQNTGTVRKKYRIAKV